MGVRTAVHRQAPLAALNDTRRPELIKPGVTRACSGPSCAAPSTARASEPKTEAQPGRSQTGPTATWTGLGAAREVRSGGLPRQVGRLIGTAVAPGPQGGSLPEKGARGTVALAYGTLESAARESGGEARLVQFGAYRKRLASWVSNRRTSSSLWPAACLWQ